MKTILITGGSGFLGTNLALQLKNNYNVVLGGRNNKQNFYAKDLTKCECLPLDVTSIESVKDVFNIVNPDIVIHAAATKFVDLSEKYPMECVDVNVVGSQNIVRACLDRNVEIAIGISTDKAAPPIRNTYGLSKALMEKIFCISNGLGKTKFACVRYGNVAWSTGSALPVWKKMCKDNGKIFSTGPHMRRFLFTVHDAVQLVNTALDNIELIKGRILSRYMKAAVMKDILDTIVKYKNGAWEAGNSRPGERIDEYLIGESELPFTRELMLNDIKHYLININEKVDKPLDKVLTSENTERLSEKEILDIINIEWDKN